MAMMRRITEINGELVRYYLLDSYGKVVRAFSSWSEANKFRITRNRPDWRIV